MQTGLTVLFQKAEEPLFRNRLHQAGFEGLRSDLIDGAGDDGAKSQQVAAYRDLEDEGAALRRGTRQLHLAATDDRDRYGWIVLVKDDGTRRHRYLNADGVEVLKSLRGQIAEHAKAAVFALCARYGSSRSRRTLHGKTACSAPWI